MSVIDWNNGQAITGLTGKLQPVPSEWWTLGKWLDKNVCFEPDGWKAIQDYINSLEYEAGYLK